MPEATTEDATLRVLTTDRTVLAIAVTPDTRPGCQHTYTCECLRCQADRAQRRPLGEGPAALKPGPSRLRRAA